jgi:hypothetical protein
MARYIRALRQLGIATALVVAGIALVSGAALAQQASGPIVVKPGAILGKADAPQPPANATKSTKAGKGKTVVGTANAADDTDSAWVETIDIDGDGNPEVTDVLWDDEDKVLFLHSADLFTCKNGGTGEGDLLIAINGSGNPRKRPAGSGFYVVSLDEGECGVKAAGLYGCRFDAKGNPTACGVVTLDEKNDDLTIVTVSESK